MAIATINIESAYYAAAGEHLPFDGIVLTDTFQLNEPSQGVVEGGFSVENSTRAKKQRQQPIRVVFSNPPYSAQQESEGDNNKNDDYPLLDERIASTYVARSRRKLFKNMYDSYIRRDSITDWALDRFRTAYADRKIEKADIFWYVYGVLHSPEYRQRFAIDLKKSIPRVPFASDFWAFSRTGRELGDLHLGYESIAPFDLHEEAKRLVMEPSDYKVTKMAFAKRDGGADRSAITFNENLVLRGIPLQAYEYTVAGKSAIEWVMEMYQVKVDPESQIRNDPNAWFDCPRDLVDLLRRVVRVSVESVRLVKALPSLSEF